MTTEQLPRPTAVRENTILAHVTFYNADGDPERTITLHPRYGATKGANKTGSKAHKALVEDIIDYFGLAGPIDWRGVAPGGGELPPTTDDPNHPVQYCPDISVYGKPASVWTLVLTTHKAHTQSGRDNAVWAYSQAELGDSLPAFIRSERSTKMADAKQATRRTRKADNAEAAEPKAPRGPVTVQLADLPLDHKPKQIEIAGTVYPVKVFGKTWREKRGDEGKRVRDDSAERKPIDDVFLYNATAYQLGDVSRVLTHPKATFVVGENGVAILQTLRPEHKDEFAKLLESADKRGLSSKPEAIKG